MEQDIQLSVVDQIPVRWRSKRSDACISRGRQPSFLNELFRSSLTYESLGIREARNRFAVSASA